MTRNLDSFHAPAWNEDQDAPASRTVTGRGSVPQGFPRSSVGTSRGRTAPSPMSGRAGVGLNTRSTLRRGMEARTLQSLVALPDAGASSWGSHAPAWEPAPIPVGASACRCPQGNRKGAPLRELPASTPRTAPSPMSGRAGVGLNTRSTLRRGMEARTLQRPVALPDAGASSWGSHAPAWEPAPIPVGASACRCPQGDRRGAPLRELPASTPRTAPSPMSGRAGATAIQLRAAHEYCASPDAHPAQVESALRAAHEYCASPDAHPAQVGSASGDAEYTFALSLMAGQAGVGFPAKEATP